MTVFIFMLLLLFLSGCAQEMAPIAGTPRRRTLEMQPAAPTEAAIPKPIPYAVLFPQAGGTPALHEPGRGAYLGAWLTPGFGAASKRSFGNLAERPHGIFGYELTLGDEVSSEWMLHALSAEAAPLFILRKNPDCTAEELPLDDLIDLALFLGMYQVPVFLALFPLESTVGVNPEAYITLFRLARVIFRAYAPLVAFVWVAPEDAQAVTPSHPFYPGHDVVDWVGLSGLALRGNDGFARDVPEIIEPFHRAFMRHKPIMLLPLGVSHFSRVDYSFYIKEAAEEIQRIYAALPGFPRVKAVVYRDAFRIGPRWDDISLTREDTLMVAYARAVACSHFLSRIESPTSDFRQWLRSDFHGYYYGGLLLIDRETLTAELGLSRIPAGVSLNGRNYIEATRLAPDIRADHERRIIYIYLPS